MTKHAGKQLEKLREHTREEYGEIGEIYCPYFDEKISFTSEGFNHIRYRKARNERHAEVQYIRYKMLSFAPDIIRNSKTLQEHETQKLFVQVKNKKKKEKILKNVEYYGFIAILKGWKVKVIVRQVGNGKKHFWSIIPNWKTRKSKDSTKKIMHTGDLAED